MQLQEQIPPNHVPALMHPVLLWLTMGYFSQTSYLRSPCAKMSIPSSPWNLTTWKWMGQLVPHSQVLSVLKVLIWDQSLPFSSASALAIPTTNPDLEKRRLLSKLGEKECGHADDGTLLSLHRTTCSISFLEGEWDRLNDSHSGDLISHQLRWRGGSAAGGEKGSEDVQSEHTSLPDHILAAASVSHLWITTETLRKVCKKDYHQIIWCNLLLSFNYQIVTRVSLVVYKKIINSQIQGAAKLLNLYN